MYKKILYIFFMKKSNLKLMIIIIKAIIFTLQNDPAALGIEVKS